MFQTRPQHNLNCNNDRIWTFPLFYGFIHKWCCIKIGFLNPPLGFCENLRPSPKIVTSFMDEAFSRKIYLISVLYLWNKIMPFFMMKFMTTHLMPWLIKVGRPDCMYLGSNLNLDLLDLALEMKRTLTTLLVTEKSEKIWIKSKIFSWLNLPGHLAESLEGPDKKQKSQRNWKPKEMLTLLQYSSLLSNYYSTET